MNVKNDETKSPERLRGRVAIVTGAAQGIGRVIADRFAREGATVMIADILADKAQTTAEEIEKERGTHVYSFAGDLSQEEAATALVQQTIKQCGQVDILVNNAGGGVILPFLEHTAETLQTTMNRNLWTTLWCCRAVLPHMVERRYGRIVNNGAESVRNGLWRHAAYNAAKGGVHGLTTGLAREFAPYGITVNTIAPSATDTEGVAYWEKQDPEYFNDIKSLIPMGRFAAMEEVAAAMAFVASDEAAFITGQVLSINGGSSML
jgi:2,3-dihydroxy-2,3-dihydro-p-cumate dehydrogenase